MGLFSSIIDGVFSLGNRTAQQMENQIDRNYNTAQAQIQRDFQERVYQQYESPMAQVNQRKAAGLNALEGVSSQSVGSGSTASASSSPLPQVQISSAWMDQIPMMIQQMKGIKLDNTFKEIQNDIALQEYITKQSDAIKAAIEADDYETAYQLQQDAVRADKDFKNASTEKIKAETQRRLMENDNYRKFKESGGNEFQDESNKVNAETKSILDLLDAKKTLINSQASYNSALKQTEDALRKGKVTSQDIANLMASLKYKIESKYGEAVANLEYRDIKEQVTRDEALHNILIALGKNEQVAQYYDTLTKQASYNDFMALPPWQRYVMSLFKEVVEKGAEFVL